MGNPPPQPKTIKARDVVTKEYEMFDTEPGQEQVERAMREIQSHRGDKKPVRNPETPQEPSDKKVLEEKLKVEKYFLNVK
ncbi:MAG: hypothetical protein MRY21_03375 [Simkaniaceae bacterium]|nr:hypothetical protein [Simkaniaceae bacterium]